MWFQPRIRKRNEQQSLRVHHHRRQSKESEDMSRAQKGEPSAGDGTIIGVVPRRTARITMAARCCWPIKRVAPARITFACNVPHRQGDGRPDEDETALRSG